jgi:DNA adenine methylase
VWCDTRYFASATEVFHGGKFNFAPKIHALAPPVHRGRGPCPETHYLHRVIPFGGGLGELWNWEPEGVSEVVCDLDWRLTNFWHVLRSPGLFERLRQLVFVTPFNENDFRSARVWQDELVGGLRQLTAEQIRPGGPASDEMRVHAAFWFLILVRFSLAGRMKAFTGITKTRVRNGMNNEVSAWLTTVEGLPEAHERLKRVLILDPAPAVEVIRKQDGPDTLFYLDPPYPHDSRAKGAADVYGEEMTDEDHGELLRCLWDVRGKVMLSSYPNQLYEEMLRPRGWLEHCFEVTSSADGARTKGKKVEIIWTNYQPPAA